MTYVKSPSDMYPGTDLEAFLFPDLFLMRRVWSEQFSERLGRLLDIACDVVLSSRLPGGVPHHPTDGHWWHIGVVEVLCTGSPQVVS